MNHTSRKLGHGKTFTRIDSRLARIGNTADALPKSSKATPTA